MWLLVLRFPVCSLADDYCQPLALSSASATNGPNKKCSRRFVASLVTTAAGLFLSFAAASCMSGSASLCTKFALTKPYTLSLCLIGLKRKS